VKNIKFWPSPHALSALMSAALRFMHIHEILSDAPYFGGHFGKSQFSQNAQGISLVIRRILLSVAILEKKPTFLKWDFGGLFLCYMGPLKA
jgi:hypothetical protein